MLRRLAARWNSDEITNRSWVCAVAGAAGAAANRWSRGLVAALENHRSITRQSRFHNAPELSLNKT